MPQQDHDIAEILPEAAPACPNRQLLLFAIRRVAACGLNDAHATHAFFITFGRSFRRPLVLLRALMAEVSRVSRTKVLVAPCCCPRLTGAEANCWRSSPIRTAAPATRTSACPPCLACGIASARSAARRRWRWRSRIAASR